MNQLWQPAPRRVSAWGHLARLIRSTVGLSTDGTPPLAQYSYDVMGRRTNLLLDCFAAIAASVMRSHLAEPEERRQNGQNTASTFDTAGRLLAHTHTLGGNPLDAVGYTLNANGWRTAIARPGGKNDTYTYDTTGQVIAATAASTAGPTSESFAYDLASNRTASSATPPDGVQGLVAIHSITINGKNSPIRLNRGGLTDSFSIFYVASLV